MTMVKHIIQKGFASNKQLGSTTDATPTTLTGSLPIGTESLVAFDILVMAVQTGGVAGAVGDSWVHAITGAIKNVSGTTTIVDNIADEYIAEDAATSAWTVSVTANDTSDILEVQVTGELNKNIDWQVVVQYKILRY